MGGTLCSTVPCSACTARPLCLGQAVGRSVWCSRSLLLGPIALAGWGEHFGCTGPLGEPSSRCDPCRVCHLQGNMFRCSASCCDNDKVGMQQVHQCIERCHAPFARAQSIVTSELERFQVRAKYPRTPELVPRGLAGEVGWGGEKYSPPGKLCSWYFC